MTDKLVYDTKNGSGSLEVSEDHKTVAVFYRSNPMESMEKVAEFDICLVWDMIRDAVATTDCSLSRSPGLFRRKGEAAAGILYTNKLFMREEI